MTSDSKPRSDTNAADGARSGAGSAVTRPRVRRWIVISAGGVLVLAVTTLVVPSFLMKLTLCGGTKTRVDIRALEAAAKDYALRNGGKWPDDLEVLVRPDVNGNRLLDRASLPVDPWGRVYRYDPRPRIYSLGRDGVAGGTGEDADVDNRVSR